MSDQEPIADSDAGPTGVPPMIDHWHYWSAESALYGCGYAERGEPCPLPHPVYASVTAPGQEPS